MANNQKPTIDPDQGAALAALLTQNGTSNPVAERVLALLEADLADRMADRQEQKDAVKRFREVRRAALIEERQKLEDRQESCPHTKPNGTTNLGGQKDGYGVYHFVCAECNKEFLGNEVPHHLKVPVHMVGGPI